MVGLVAILLALLLAAPAGAGEVLVAVAANFTAPAKEIAGSFKAKTGYAADLSFGATGQLYAQIAQGAPFDILLAADDERPKRAEREGWAVSGSRFTYALGKLLLYSEDPALIDAEGAVLKSGPFRHLAIASPEAAPYGAAAIETMKALGVFGAIEPKLVTGANIGQTFQFVASGNAELGFVALSQAIGQGKGSRWLVPETLYTPIRQDAALLKHGGESRVAKAFIEFLKGPDATAVIKRYGYGLPAGR